jgi:predicted GIY-YIG superfamily endonuclease
MAVRARQLAGSDYISRMFCIPVHDKASVARLAELALGKLFRMPKQMAYLRQLDILLIDEFGLVSAKLLSVMDIILRRVRDNSMFMGGVLVIATLDHMQLQSIGDRPSLLSPHIMTCFDTVMLHHSVRASGDANLRAIQDISRLLPTQWTEDIVRQFRHLIETNCTFVKKDEQVSSHIVRIFGKHVATRIAEQNMLRHVRLIHLTNIISRHSEDYESTPEGQWIPSSNVTSSYLDTKVKEPRVLHFFPRGIYEVTFNDRKGAHSQSQLATLIELPQQDDIRNFRPVRMLLAPNGCKNAPPNTTSATDLVEKEKWSYCSIPTAPERPQYLRFGISGKRIQYGLKHRIALTVHAAMGQDLAAIVTKVRTLAVDEKYALWLPSQVVVLLSRTFFAKDIHFIGTAAETCDALLQVLLKRTQYSEYMARILEAISGRPTIPDQPNTLNTQHFYPFRLSDLQLPSDNSGFVYLLISMRDYKTTYIGQTRRIVKRLIEHNSMYGSTQTANSTLQPWALLAIICGFENDRHKMLRVEKIWKLRRNDRKKYSDGILEPDMISGIGANMISNHPEFASLRFMQCGTLLLAK